MKNKKGTKSQKDTLDKERIASFSEFKKLKGVDPPTMMRVLEDVFRTLIRKKYGTDDNFDIIVNTEDADLEIWRGREIVPDGEVEDDRFQIAISDALNKDKKEDEEGVAYEIGDDCYEQVRIASFGRRAIMAARQTLISRILEIEKDKIYKMYVDNVGDVIRGEVHQILKREIVVVDDETDVELLLPKSEMVQGDFFKKGEVLRAVITKVDMRNNSPVILLSRADNLFLERLLEQEVPEIEEGIISIKKIVRVPGERAKVAVESYDDRIDPVGACVGIRGSRIHGIVRELKNENIDIINYTENESLLIQRSLTPAKINSMELDTENRKVAVYLNPEEISKAIGRKGVNIKLASRLTSYTIDVFSEAESNEYEEDIDLTEFSDIMEDWLIETFKSIGCDTAKNVLALSREELIRRTDLEEETIDEIIRILNAEFENE